MFSKHICAKIKLRFEFIANSVISFRPLCFTSLILSPSFFVAFSSLSHPPLPSFKNLFQPHTSNSDFTSIWLRRRRRRHQRSRIHVYLQVLLFNGHIIILFVWCYAVVWGIDLRYIRSRCIGIEQFSSPSDKCVSSNSNSTINSDKKHTSKFPQQCYKHVHFKLNGKTLPPKE